jgi:hypothetical protein
MKLSVLDLCAMTVFCEVAVEYTETHLNAKFHNTLKLSWRSASCVFGDQAFIRYFDISNYVFNIIACPFKV